eukprot:4206354-Pleurochrysis_carterae.AAC.2
MRRYDDPITSNAPISRHPQNQRSKFVQHISETLRPPDRHLAPRISMKSPGYGALVAHLRCRLSAPIHRIIP